MIKLHKTHNKTTRYYILVYVENNVTLLGCDRLDGLDPGSGDTRDTTIVNMVNIVLILKC